MPRLTNSPISRKQLIILLIAIVLALGFLLIRAERAAAQITGEDYQSAVTLERLMILGMLGLVVLTWFYLKWRPPPDREDEQFIQSDRE
jgi:cell division protein FtsW (lipid II flippase)